MTSLRDAWNRLQEIVQNDYQGCDTLRNAMNDVAGAIAAEIVCRPTTPSGSQEPKIGDLLVDMIWRKCVGQCIGKNCGRLFISRERFDEHIAPLIRLSAASQGDPHNELIFDGQAEQAGEFWRKVLVGFDVETSVAEYEFRGDEGCYTPNEKESILMIDFAHGLIGELIEAIEKG